jgi:hypothetical protein
MQLVFCDITKLHADFFSASKISSMSIMQLNCQLITINKNTLILRNRLLPSHLNFKTTARF